MLNKEIIDDYASHIERYLSYRKTHSADETAVYIRPFFDAMIAKHGVLEWDSAGDEYEKNYNQRN